MPAAEKTLCDEFSWTEAHTGWIFSALALMYGIGQFVNGQLADRFGSRLIASLGAFGSVGMNLAVYAFLLFAGPEQMGSDTILLCLILFWGSNGFFQSMGWAPMVRIMAHWYREDHRGRIMGFLGTCYQFGAAFASLLALFLTGYYVTRFHGDWRMVFFVPAVIFAVVGACFVLFIRNWPEDVGLPAVNPDDNPHGSQAVESPSIFRNMFRTLSNPFLWIVAGSFFFLDLNRYGFVNWLPKYLTVHGPKEAASLAAQVKLIVNVCILPLGGAAGAIVAGWATDRFFGSRRAPVITILLVCLGVLSIVFPFIRVQNTGVMVVIVALIGFCTYGPHILMVGHAAQDFGKKSGAAGAAGFIDAMGYIGATIAGWGAGKMIVKYDYRVTFIVFGVAALIGALLAGLIWTVRPVAHTSSSSTPQE